MKMTGRERLLTTIHNGKPDRLPCLIHAWVDYHLKNTMHGMDQFQAYECIGMDPVIYTGPNYIYNAKDYANWTMEQRDLGVDADGNHLWERFITTPKGVLTEKGSFDDTTSWATEFIIKIERDFDLWSEYVPLPERIDWAPVREAKRKVGENGIVRGYAFDFGQLSPWQTFSSILYGTQPAIMACYDRPDWMHHMLDDLLKKKLTVLGRSDTLEYDLVESGGGGASSTVISTKPSMITASRLCTICAAV
jgi:uroporphyrinogen decarboxylase